MGAVTTLMLLASHETRLKAKQEREIVYVLLVCGDRRSTIHFIRRQKLCSELSSFKHFPVSFWDRFKRLADKSDQDDHSAMQRMLNSAKLLAHLTVHFSLSLAVLKVVDFGPDMSKRAVIYFHTFIFAILCDPLCVGEDDDVGIDRMDAGRQGPEFKRIREIFSRIGTSTDHALVRQGLAFFLRHHLIDRLSRKIKRLKSSRTSHKSVSERKEAWKGCVLRKRRAKAALSCLDRMSLE